MSTVLNASKDAVPTVLFVDDEPSILSSLRRLFRPQGYEVLLADSAKGGLELLERHPVDVVVSDMRMPEMNGAEFLEQVRLRWPSCSRILLTGYADITSTIAAINGGEIHRYVAKPWDDQEMLLCVREALSRKRLEDDNRSLLALTQQQNETLQTLNASLEQRVRARTQEIEQVNNMLQQAYEQLEHNFMLTLDVFTGLLEMREGSAAGQSREVAKLARRLAVQMNLGRQAEQDVFAAGLLHDLGRIALPDELLRKPVSAMNADELQRYRRHPLNAEAALMPLAELKRSAKFVRWQHERVDGKGFPDGLAGSEVPVQAQILGLAVDFHELQSGRLAQRHYSEDDAVNLVLAGRGQRYSDVVVQAFEALRREQVSAPPRDRLVAAADVQVGMVLSRDLLSPKGNLLLAAGFVFDAHVVKQLKEFAERESGLMQLYVELAPSSGFEGGGRHSELTAA